MVRAEVAVPEAGVPMVWAMEMLTSRLGDLTDRRAGAGEMAQTLVPQATWEMAEMGAEGVKAALLQPCPARPGMQRHSVETAETGAMGATGGIMHGVQVETVVMAALEV